MRQGPPRRWTWANLFDTSSDGEGNPLGCANKLLLPPSEACTSQLTINLIPEMALDGGGILEEAETLTLGALEADFWFLPDLSDIESEDRGCEGADVTIEIRAGLVHCRGTAQNTAVSQIPTPFLQEPQPDWASARWLHRWHHIYDVRDGCIATDSNTASGSEGQVAYNFSATGEMPVECSMVTGTLADGTGDIDTSCVNDVVSGLSFSGTATVPSDTLNVVTQLTGFELRYPGPFHLRLRKRRKLVFRQYDALFLVVAFSDPFDDSTMTHVPINAWGAARGLVSLG